MRIAIEGMDGVGKTTLAKILVKKLDYEYVDKPFKFLFDGLNLDENEIKNIEWKLYETQDEALITLFYGMGLLYGTRCNLSENIIYDRHFVSNYYWHGTEETETLHNELIKLCGEPDLTILLKAKISTRMKRIYDRNHDDKDLSNCAMYDDGYDKMEKFLESNGFDYIVIDTDNLMPDEVADIALKNIEKRKIKVLAKEGK